MECARCELRKGCHNVVWGRGPIGAKYMFVAECPTDEDELMEEPLMSREGNLFRSLIQRSNISPDETYLTYAVKCNNSLSAAKKLKAARDCRYWLDREISQLKPVVVVTLGRLPTSLLLKLPAKTSMESVVGQRTAVTSPDAVVYPWFSPSWILQHGKKSDVATIQFLTKIREFVNDSVSEVPVSV